MNIKNAGLTLPSVMLMSSVTILAGCMNGVYTVDSKIDYDDEKTGALNYEVLTDSSHSFKDRNLRGDTIPIFVKEEKSVSTDDHSGLMLLWGLTLGVFPYYHSSSAQYTVFVQSPIGAKEATYSVNTRDWAGWFPCLIPIPGWGVERTYGKETDSETRDRIAGEIHNKVVKSLVGEFSKDEYATYVKSVEDQRAKEAERVKQKVSELEGLMTAGKFEEAIVACRDERTKTGKEEPWKGLIEKGVGGLRNSVPTIKDVKRLASMFALSDDAELREAVVLQLGALKEVKSLSADALNKIVAESSKKDVKIAAIQGIESKEDLFQIARLSHDAEVIVSVFKQINDAKSVREFVLAGESSGERIVQVQEEASEVDVGVSVVDPIKFKSYVEVFGTEAELLNVLEVGVAKMTPELCNIIREKSSSESVRSKIKEVCIKTMLAEFNDEDFKEKLFAEIYMKLLKMEDRNTRIEAAEYAMDRHMKLNGNTLQANSLVFLLNKGLREDAIKSYIGTLSHAYCDKLVDRIVINSEEIWILDCVIRNMSTEERERRIMHIKSQLSKRSVIHFEGFHVGMTLVECRLLAYDQKKCPTKVEVSSGKVVRLLFNRSNRYAMFEKEDGEFWAAFLKKYVPAGKPKSLGAAIEDVLNESAFEYQQGYDSKLEEMCYIYKSMKYGTKVLFGLDSGTLELRQLK